MEELKVYKIYCHYDNRRLDYPMDELVDIVLATPSEMKELEEKGSYAGAPYGNEYVEYRAEESDVPRYDAAMFADAFKDAKGNKCGECLHFKNGCCEIYTSQDENSATFLACEKFEKGTTMSF